MPLVETSFTSSFSKLREGSFFKTKATLFTRSGGKDDEKDYLFKKTGKQEARTLDHKTLVHFLSNQKVTLCVY